jgi:hypothetical protein
MVFKGRHGLSSGKAGQEYAAMIHARDDNLMWVVRHYSPCAGRGFFEGNGFQVFCKLPDWSILLTGIGLSIRRVMPSLGKQVNLWKPVEHA